MSDNEWLRELKQYAEKFNELPGITVTLELRSASQFVDTETFSGIKYVAINGVFIEMHWKKFGGNLSTTASFPLLPLRDAFEFFDMGVHSLRSCYNQLVKEINLPQEPPSIL